VAVSLALPADARLDGVRRALSGVAEIEAAPGRALLCVVGSGLGRDDGTRGPVLAALGEVDPELVSLGGSGTSVTAVVPGERLADAVRALHRRFFETGRAEVRS